MLPSLADDRVIGTKQRSIANPPALRGHEHAPAPVSFKGKGRTGVVDEAANLLLEVGPLSPDPNVDEGGPVLVELPHHLRELLTALNPVEELGHQT